MNPRRCLSGSGPRGRRPNPRDTIATTIPALSLSLTLSLTLSLALCLGLPPLLACAAADPAPPTPDAPVPAALRPADGDACGGVDFAGCCDAETVLWCEDDRVRSLDCGARPRCGWRAASGYHDCHTGGGADPDGRHPRDCPWIAFAARGDEP